MQNPMDLDKKSSVTDQSFQNWLHSTKEEFKSLTDEQKTHTLKTILEYCECEQLCYLTQVYIPTHCQIDFITLLPRHISFKILRFLNGDSLKHSCLVSKSWYQLINSSKEIWLHMFWKEGGRKGKYSVTPEISRSMFLEQQRLKKKLQDESKMDRIHVRPGGDIDYVVKCLHYRDPFIATCSENRTVYIWNAKTDQHESTIEAHSVCQVKFDDEYVYTASYDNTAASWVIETGRLHCRYIGHINGVMTIDYLKEMRLVLTGSADTTIKLWDMDTGDLVKTFPGLHSGWVKQVRFLKSPLAGALVILSSDTKGKVCLWSVNFGSGKEILGIFDVIFEFSSCITSPFIAKDQTLCISGASILPDQRAGKDFISFYKLALDGNNGRNKLKLSLVREVTVPSTLSLNRELIAAGQRFAIFHVTEEVDIDTRSFICVIDLELGTFFTTLKVPHESRYGEPPTLGDTDWLDGFSSDCQPELLLAVVQYKCCVVTLYYCNRTKHSKIEEHSYSVTEDGLM